MEEDKHLKALLFRFWDYWIENTDTAGTGYKRVILLIAVLSPVVAVILYALNLRTDAGQLTARISALFAIFFTGSCLLWIPFRRHESQIKKSGETLANLITAHNAERQQLSDEIRRLKDENQKVPESTKTVIQTLYERLLELREAYHSFTADNNAETYHARKQLFDERASLFLHFLNLRKLTINSLLYRRLESFHEVLFRSAIEFSVAMSQSKSSDYRTTPRGQLFDRYCAISKNIPELFGSLVETLRDSIGASSSNREAEIAHDKEVFQRLNVVIDEKQFVEFFDLIRTCFFYDRENYSTICKLEEFGALTSNTFLSKELQSEFRSFLATLAKTLTDIGNVFFDIGGNRRSLYPDLKNHEDARKRQIFDDAREKTETACSNLLDAYTKFRLKVKNTLML